MRTAGVLQMDTALPDGRFLISPTAISGGGTIVTGVGFLSLNVTGAAAVLNAVPSLLMRYGMSDDAQQQYGMGAPGTQGLQGAQAQPVTPGQPFTSPYGRSGRPPYPSNTGFSPVNARPKGLKPTAVTVAYTVTGGPLTALQVSVNKLALNVGVAPVATILLGNTALPLQTAQTQLITTPIPVANQQWLADPFDVLDITLGVTAGAATMSIYGIFLDVSFNFN